MAKICHLGCWRQNAKTQFSGKLSNLELWCLLTTYRKLLIRLFKEPIIGSLKSKMAEIHHLENRHDVIFFCRVWSDLDKISQTGAEWHVDCSDVVKMKPDVECRCTIAIWQRFGRIQWHVIPEPPATLQGAATWWIHCHDTRARCHTLQGAVTWQNQCHDRATLQGVRIPSAILRTIFRHILFYFCF